MAEAVWVRGGDFPPGARWYLKDDERLFEAWRVGALLILEPGLAYLAQPTPRAPANVQTLASWIRGSIDLEAVMADGPASRTRFWCIDVDAQELPEFWLSSEIERYQVEWKLGHGSPLDAQHAGYMRECDLFLSGDRRYVEALARLGANAPFSFAEPRHVAVAGDVYARLEDELRLPTASVLNTAGSRLLHPAQNRSPVWT